MVHCHRVDYLIWRSAAGRPNCFELRTRQFIESSDATAFYWQLCRARGRALHALLGLATTNGTKIEVLDPVLQLNLKEP